MRACTSQDLKQTAKKRHRVLQLLHARGISLELEVSWYMQAGCTTSGSYDEQVYDQLHDQLPLTGSPVLAAEKAPEGERKQTKSLGQIFQMPQVGSQDAMYRCSKCKSTDISVVMRQTRSADEGASAFFTCNSCGNKWHSR